MSNETASVNSEKTAIQTPEPAVTRQSSVQQMTASEPMTTEEREEPCHKRHKQPDDGCGSCCLCYDPCYCPTHSHHTSSGSGDSCGGSDDCKGTGTPLDLILIPFILIGLICVCVACCTEANKKDDCKCSECKKPVSKPATSSK